MNDTIAIIGTPIMLILSKKKGISAKFFALPRFAVTLERHEPIGIPDLLVCMGGEIRALLSLLEHRFSTVLNLYLPICCSNVFKENSTKRISGQRVDINISGFHKLRDILILSFS